MPADKTGAVGSYRGSKGQDRTSATVEEQGSAHVEKYGIKYLP